MVKNGERITVMIPTYNRKDCLVRLLDCLRRQTCQDFDIVISDNHSRYDVAKAVAEYTDFFGDRLRLHVRSDNAGSTVNINGVFSMAQTKWGWLMGDDDFPFPHAVECIYRYLDDSVAALHFSLYDLSYFIQDYKDLYDIDAFISLFWKMSHGRHEVINLQGDLICMSGKVYNLDMTRRYLCLQNTYGYTRVPQVVSILYMLAEKRGAFRVVDQKLFAISDTDNQSWKMADIALGLTTFSHIPFPVTPEQRKKLNLIVMFKYSHVLRYRLQGEISRYHIGLIYDGIYKRSLGFKDRLVFHILMRLNPSGPIARCIVGYKNKRVRMPQSKPREGKKTHESN